MSNNLRQRVRGENLPPINFCRWVFKLFVTNFWIPMGSKIKTFPKSFFFNSFAVSGNYLKKGWKARIREIGHTKMIEAQVKARMSFVKF